MKVPKVEIQGLSIDENDYDDGVNRWNCLKLIEHSKQFPVFDMPLAGINIDIMPWGKDQTIHSLVWHMKRVENTSLDHPIILDSRGYIADGWHRICKALLEEKETIKAIRLQSMPKPDNIDEE